MDIELDGTSDDSFLVAAAVYAVLTDRIEGLYGAVEALRSSADPFVRETADWVSHHLAWSPDRSAEIPQRDANVKSIPLIRPVSSKPTS